jgi:hypothetical protein
MKPTIINQEILLVTRTSFSKRQLCEMDAQDKNSNLAPEEQLEAACWNGLVDELLPEIVHQSSYDEKLFLWQVEMRTSYLRISIGVCPPVLEEQFTLDPHIFLCTQEMN